MGVIAGTVNTLRNLIPSKLSDDDPVMETDWNKAVDAISNCITALDTLDKKLTPVGMIYIQLPGKSLPTSMWPGTSWSDVSGTFAGGFFRAKGGNADNSGARQGDAIRNITGNVGEFVSCGSDLNSGAFRYGGSNMRYGYGGGGDYYHKRSSFDASRVAPTAPENRPVNYAVTIWQCTAA